MEKVTGIFSFYGGIVLVFLGVGLMLMDGDQNATYHQLQSFLMTLVFLLGTSTFAHILISASKQNN